MRRSFRQLEPIGAIRKCRLRAAPYFDGAFEPLITTLQSIDAPVYHGGEPLSIVRHNNQRFFASTCGRNASNPSKHPSESTSLASYPEIPTSKKRERPRSKRVGACSTGFHTRIRDAADSRPRKNTDARNHPSGGLPTQKEIGWDFDANGPWLEPVCGARRWPRAEYPDAGVKTKASKVPKLSD